MHENAVSAVHFTDGFPFGAKRNQVPLDYSDLIRNIKCVVVGSQSNERLLLPVGTNERVHFARLNTVELRDRLTNFPLVRPNVYNKHQRIVIFH